MDIYTTLNLKIDETQELIHSNLEAKNNLKQESLENTSQFTNSKKFSRKLCSNFNLKENSSTDSNFFAPKFNNCKSGHNLDSPFISESSASLQFSLPSNKKFRNDNNSKISGKKSELFQDLSKKKDSNDIWASSDSCFISKLSLNSDKAQNVRNKFNDSCLC